MNRNPDLPPTAAEGADLDDRLSHRGGDCRPAASAGRRRHLPEQVRRHAVALHRRLGLSLRETRSVLRARGVEVSHETLRSWAEEFGAASEHSARPPNLEAHWTMRVEPVVVRRELMYVCEARTPDGDVLETLLRYDGDPGAAALQLAAALRQQVRLAARANRG